MRNSMMIAVGMGMVLGLAAAWAWGDEGGAATKQSNPAEIARLIEQLGGKTAAEREAAQDALEKIGEPAVEALHVATADKNAERAARARATLHKIEAAARRVRLQKADERITALLGI